VPISNALEPGVTAPSSWSERLRAALVGCGLTAVLTQPTVLKIGHAGRLDSGDGRFSIWNVAWVAHALLDDPRHLLDANIFYPHTGTLAFSELNLVAGVLAIPAYAITRNPIATLNVVILMVLFASFMSMWTLVRRLTGSSGAGLIAATGFAFSAYTASHTAQIQLLMIFGFPLLMLAFHSLIVRPRPMAGVWLGGALALTALACGYYGVFCCGLFGLATLWWAGRSRNYYLALGLAFVVTAALVMPVFVAYARARATEGAVRTMNVEELRNYSADVRTYLTSGTTLDGKWLGALYKPGDRLNEVLFPGIVVIGLAAVGLVTGARAAHAKRVVWFYATMAALAVWASFGPDGGLYYLLMKTLPGISLLRTPNRLGVVVIFALAVIAGFGVRHLARGRAWLAPLLLGALVIELWAPWPLHDMLPVPKAYTLLGNLPRGAVVELPFEYRRMEFHQHTKPMLMSTFHWQPLVNGYSDYIPPDFEAIAGPINEFPDRGSFDIMHARQVRYVIWKVREYGTFADALLARLPEYAAHLRLITDDRDVRLYEIVSWPGGQP